MSRCLLVRHCDGAAQFDTLPESALGAGCRRMGRAFGIALWHASSLTADYPVQVIGRRCHVQPNATPQYAEQGGGVIATAVPRWFLRRAVHRQVFQQITALRQRLQILHTSSGSPSEQSRRISEKTSNGLGNWIIFASDTSKLPSLGQIGWARSLSRGATCAPSVLRHAPAC